MLNEQRRPRTLTLEELESRVSGAEQPTDTDTTRIPATSGKTLSLADLQERISTVKTASFSIPEIARQATIEQQGIEGNPFLSRAQSAGNAFMAGITSTLPLAIKTKAVVENFLWNSLSGGKDNVLKSFDYLGGELIAKEIQETFPENPEYQEEFWAGTMARAAGQFLPQIGLTLATAGAGTVGVFAANAMYSASLSSSFYEEALAEGASEEQAFGNMLLNMGGNVGLEAIPMARMVKRVNELTGGGIARVAKAGFKGSVDEAVTEALQQTYSNMLAINIYDSTRNILDGVAESALAGGILGGVAGSTIMALNSRKIQAIREGDGIMAGEIDVTIDSIFETHGDQLGDFTRNDLDEFTNNVVQPDKPTPPDAKYTQEEIDMVEAAYESGDFEAVQERFGKRIEDEFHGSVMGIVEDVQAEAQRLKSMQKSTELETTDKIVEAPTGLAIPSGRTRMEGISTWGKIKTKLLTWYPYKKRLGLIKEHAKNAIQGDLRQSIVTATRLNQAILTHYGSKSKNVVKAINKGEVPRDVSKLIDAALRSPDAMAALPIDLRQPVQDMRDHIKLLSARMIKEGLVDGDLAVDFVENFGSYIHRTYKLFDAKTEWNLNTIPQEDINKALAHIRNRINAQAKAEGKDMTPNAIKLEAERRLMDLLHKTTKSNMPQLMRELELVNKDKGDTDVLMKREDIHPTIRKVMGEVADPVVNYVNTIAKMSDTLEMRLMYDKMATEFAGDLFFTKEQLEGLADRAAHSYQINTGYKGKFDNMYMHKDLHDALLEVKRGKQSTWLTALYRGNAAAKYSKTILSHVTVARNIVGGMAFLGFNGHLYNPRSFVPAWNAAKLAFTRTKNLDRKGLTQERLRMIRLGMIGKSVTAGELIDMAKYDARLEGDPNTAALNIIEDLATGRSAKGIKKSVSKFFTNAARFYQAGDDFVRLWMFQLEKQQLQAADPNITDQDVADIVNEIYQNYDRVGELAKGFRRVPFIAPFVSFPAEVARTTLGTASRIRQEVSSDNPKMKKIGYKRLAGAVGTFTGFIAAGAASQMLLDISDEEDRAYREFMPPWDKNSVIVYTRAQDGTVKYFNTSYTNPYAYLVDPFFALALGQPDDTVLDVLTEGLKTAFEPILNPEIFAQTLVDIRTNTTPTGGEIYNPQDVVGDKAEKIIMHLWKAFEPGSLTSVKRAVEPMYDQNSRKKSEEEFLGLMGLRMITVDVQDSYGFAIRDMRQEIRDARRVYNSVKFREGASSAEIREAFNRSNAQYRAIFERMRNLNEAAKATGATSRELEKIMEDSGLSSRDIQAIRRNTFQPFDM